MFRFLGTRGTIPVSGKGFTKYGGNTACMVIPTESEKCVVLDGGSGLYSLNTSPRFKEYHIFLTHLHWDHVCGIPLFSPFYSFDSRIFLYVEEKPLASDDFLQVLFNPPFFPIPRKMLKADIQIRHIRGGMSFDIGDVSVYAAEGNHPDGALMFRVERGERSLVFATDYEHDTPKDDFLIEFAYKSDYLVFDTTYTPDEYKSKKGWGHSTYEMGAWLANKSQAANLVLFHHNPDYDDAAIDAIFEAAKKLFPSVICSYDGLELK